MVYSETELQQSKVWQYGCGCTYRLGVVMSGIRVSRSNPAGMWSVFTALVAAANLCNKLLKLTNTYVLLIAMALVHFA